MATDNVVYKQGNAGSITTVEDLLSYIQDELGSLEFALSLVLQNPITTKYAAPTKPRDGLTVLADGTHWNPGGGQGVYTYYAGAWHKLG